MSNDERRHPKPVGDAAESRSAATQFDEPALPLGADSQDEGMPRVEHAQANSDSW
jgi:hypothetical protein